MDFLRNLTFIQEKNLSTRTIESFLNLLLTRGKINGQHMTAFWKDLLINLNLS